MKKLLFVYNPFSGKGLIRIKLSDILDRMVKAGYEVTVHPTQSKEDARTLMEEAAGRYELIVCSGGDGTLDEVVSGMVKSGACVPIGYIPAGSTNDFANSLGLSKDMMQAAETALTGAAFPCDAGFFNEKVFVYVAAFGLFTDVSYLTDQNLKNILGHAAYILEGAKRLADITAYHMTVEYDGQIVDGDFLYGMITNSTSVGGFEGMTGKDVLLDDGLFEVTLIRMPQNMLELNEILASLTNLIPSTELVLSFKTKQIRFSSPEKVPWTLDGEYGGSESDALIRNARQAVTLMVEEKREEH